jgi:hypothetical protein
MVFASILKSRGFENVIDIHEGWVGMEKTDIETSNYVCPTEMEQSVIDEALAAVS